MIQPIRTITIAAVMCAAAMASYPGDVMAADKPSAKTATIKGRVIYNVDTERPWRLGRYYIKSKSNGQLASAVVGLESESLKTKSPKPKPKTITIDQVNFEFTPETIAIQAGDTVRFTNADDALHSVLTASGLKPFNITVAKGGEYLHPFNQPRDFNPIYIQCAFHGAMRAWIYVFDHPFHHITSTDGAYQLNNIPPGTYTLRMAHPPGSLAWSQTITLKPGQTLELDIEVSPDNLLGQ